MREIDEEPIDEMEPGMEDPSNPGGIVPNPEIEPMEGNQLDACPMGRTNGQAKYRNRGPGTDQNIKENQNKNTKMDETGLHSMMS